MDSLSERSGQPRLLKILGRALLSTVVIGLVAVAGVSFRMRQFEWAAVREVVDDYWGFLVIVFFAVVIWDFWAAKTKQGRRDGF
jgi:sterol desaturase/sphingolipid hydroxylase (fatty acid hydroxylase superfamily)